MRGEVVEYRCAIFLVFVAGDQSGGFVIEEQARFFWGLEGGAIDDDVVA